MPVGKVRFYDAEKGFGFLTKDEGGDVYVRATALPPGVTSLKAGQKVEFGVVEGRKGEQALSLRVLEAPPSLSKAQRKPPEQMTVIIEDLIKMLDSRRQQLSPRPPPGAQDRQQGGHRAARGRRRARALRRDGPRAFDQARRHLPGRGRPGARGGRCEAAGVMGVGEHLGCPGRGRPGASPTSSPAPTRVRRLALVGDRGPGVPGQGRHRRRGRAAARRRTRWSRRPGCRGPSGSSTAT